MHDQLCPIRDTPFFCGPLLETHPSLSILQTATPLTSLSLSFASKAMASGGFNDTLKWTFGLINSANKYLTAEAFQSKVTCNGNTLKKKQIWTLERVGEKEVALKSHLGKYLTADRDGKLDASGEEIGDDQKFEFLTQDDGKIAIRNVKHNRYIGGTGDKLTGYDLEIGPTNLFTIHLAMHPQINLRSVNRRTYCHLDENEIRCNEEIPWGFDAMIVLEFHGGKYAIRAANQQYLSRTGALVDPSKLGPDCLYVLVFRDVQVAFRDCRGKYLTAVGASATVQSRKDTISKDELFVLEDSHPQVRLIASNGKYVSIRDGVEVRANQGAFTDCELFQMEAVDRTDRTGQVKWAFHSKNKKYWHSAGTVVSDQEDFSRPASHFEIEWMGPMIALKANNGKYITVKPNGQMTANSAEITDQCKFVFEFLNRPILVVRGEFGFVGVKGASAVLECNRSNYDLFIVEGSAGSYQLRGVNGKYWKVESDGSLSVNGDKPVDYFLELRAHTHMCIIAPNGQYIKGQQSGGFTADGGTTVSSSTLWEY